MGIMEGMTFLEDEVCKQRLSVTRLQDLCSYTVQAYFALREDHMHLSRHYHALCDTLHYQGTLKLDDIKFRVKARRSSELLCFLIAHWEIFHSIALGAGVQAALRLATASASSKQSVEAHCLLSGLVLESQPAAPSPSASLSSAMGQDMGTSESFCVAPRELKVPGCSRFHPYQERLGTVAAMRVGLVPGMEEVRVGGAGQRSSSLSMRQAAREEEGTGNCEKSCSCLPAGDDAVHLPQQRHGAAAKTALQRKLVAAPKLAKGLDGEDDPLKAALASKPLSGRSGSGYSGPLAFLDTPTASNPKGNSCGSEDALEKTKRAEEHVSGAITCKEPAGFCHYNIQGSSEEWLKSDMYQAVTLERSSPGNKRNQLRAFHQLLQTPRILRIIIQTFRDTSVAVAHLLPLDWNCRKLLQQAVHVVAQAAVQRCRNCPVMGAPDRVGGASPSPGGGAVAISARVALQSPRRPPRLRKEARARAREPPVKRGSAGSAVPAGAAAAGQLNLNLHALEDRGPGHDAQRSRLPGRQGMAEQDRPQVPTGRAAAAGQLNLNLHALEDRGPGHDARRSRLPGRQGVAEQDRPHVPTVRAAAAGQPSLNLHAVEVRGPGHDAQRSRLPRRQGVAEQDRPHVPTARAAAAGQPSLELHDLEEQGPGHDAQRSRLPGRQGMAALDRPHRPTGQAPTVGQPSLELHALEDRGPGHDAQRSRLPGRQGLAEQDRPQRPTERAAQLMQWKQQQACKMQSLNNWKPERSISLFLGGLGRSAIMLYSGTACVGFLRCTCRWMMQIISGNSSEFCRAFSECLASGKRAIIRRNLINPAVLLLAIPAPSGMAADRAAQDVQSCEGETQSASSSCTSSTACLSSALPSGRIMR